MNGSPTPRHDWSRPSLGDLLGALRLMAAAAPIACLASLVMALAAGTVPAAVAWATGSLVQSVEAGMGHVATSSWVAVGVLGVTVLIGELVTAVEPMVNVVLAERYTSRLQAEMMQSVNSLTTIDYFDDPILAQRYEVARWASTEPTTLVNALWHLIRWAMTAASTGLVAATIAWWAPLAIILLCLVITTVRWQQLGLQTDAQLEHVAARVQSAYCYRLGVTLPAAKELRTLGIQQWLRERQSSLWHMASRPVIAEARRGLRRDVMIEASRGIGLAACLLYVASIAAHSGLSPSEVTTSIIALASLLVATSGLEEILLTLGRSMQFLPNLSALLSLGQRSSPPPSPPRLLPTLREDGIRFEGVTFSYPGSRTPAVERADIFIPSGSVIAIVGENGSGKSTLLKLLCRLYDPQSGRITVNGTDIRELDVHALRRNTAALFQDFCQLPLTLRENVGLGCVDRARDRHLVEEAGRLGGLSHIVGSLPDGWNTCLSREFGGTELSGGQWQRVAFARCMAAVQGRDARLLLLDEPTASLDRLEEAALFDRLQEVSAGRTTVLVTHRLALAALAHRVVVMDRGRVVEEGDHRQLLERAGPYRRAYMSHHSTLLTGACS